MTNLPTQPPEEPSASSLGSHTPTHGLDTNGNAISPRMRNGIALVITTVWAGSFVADVTLASFETSPFIYMTMLGLAAAIFGSGFVKGIK